MEECARSHQLIETHLKSWNRLPAVSTRYIHSCTILSMARRYTDEDMSAHEAGENRRKLNSLLDRGMQMSMALARASGAASLLSEYLRYGTI